jgi:hypothetical protein
MQYSIPLPNNPLSLSSLGSSLVGVDLLAILVVSNTWGRSTVAATFAGTDTVRELSVLLFFQGKEARPRYHLESMHTEQFCREWRKRRSIATSGTSWERCIQGIQMRRRYHLFEQVSLHPNKYALLFLLQFNIQASLAENTYEWRQIRPCCGW